MTPPSATDPTSPSRPLLDAFGSRLDPHELLQGLQQQGLTEVGLRASDNGITVVSNIAANDERAARALTWLRTRLSPLVSVKLEHGAPKPELEDTRTRFPVVVSLAELFDPIEEISNALSWLLRRLRLQGGGAARAAAIFSEELSPPMDHFARKLSESVASLDLAASISVLDPKLGLVEQSSPNAELHLLLWLRPGSELGIRQAALMAASTDSAALRWLARAMTNPFVLPIGQDILLDGVAWGVSRRPTIAAQSGGPAPLSPIRVDLDRCSECTLCEQLCPTGYLGKRGLPKLEDPAACLLCYECVEACPVDALRPVYGPETALLTRTLMHRPGWLSRLVGARGPSFPAPFPPSYLLPKPEAKAEAKRPFYVLGLAVMTMQEHAAVLLKDGKVVGAIEKERLTRQRHAGWHPPERPGVTAAIDPTLCIEETFCRGPIRALLEEEGITIEDIDLIAVNGLHGRLRRAFSFLDAEKPIPALQVGRVLYVPHHLAHAASAFRLGGARSAWIMTIDGRGDRECGAVFRAEDGEIRPVRTVLALDDRSIGGVYEGVTRILGFGGHGQGSTMALAAFGAPTENMAPFLGVNQDGELVVHESGLDTAFESQRRRYDQPMTAEHHNLAASLQQALERVAVHLLEQSAGSDPLEALCLAGGVALNCRMNNQLRLHFSPEQVFVQPGANDAGTAMGAALEGWHRASEGEPAAPLEGAYLGPEMPEDLIEVALQRSGLVYKRPANLVEAVAERLASGQIVCWFQGRMEFGPRALGARSILADPRNSALKDRLNAIKDRQPWRPFGPSILAGFEEDWLEHGFDSRFMLFTLPVPAEKRSAIPVVIHVDGTTRPQVVHPTTHPIYHELISAFHRLTGIPMVVNTSFNRRGEPIVCTPEDAVDSFIGLGRSRPESEGGTIAPDALAIGPFIVEHPLRVAPPEEVLPSDAELSQLPGGRRLALRITRQCNWSCRHCTLDDIPTHAERSTEEALLSLARGRRASCDELVIMRGEATLRADLPLLVERARGMGYRFVQIQTNAFALTRPYVRDALLAAGVDTFEVTVLAASEEVHDRLSGATGTLRPTLAAIQTLVRSGRDVLFSIPVLQQNLPQLQALVRVAAKLGVKRIQFNFPRPVELPTGIRMNGIPRLVDAAVVVARAATLAESAGLQASTEAFPFCLLPESLRSSPEVTEDWSRHRVDDLHLTHERLGAHRRQHRPEAPPCRTCRFASSCPKTWATYLELFGSDELTTL